MRTRGFEEVDKEFKKHTHNITLPRRSDDRSCAYDFYSPLDICIRPNEQILIPTDVKAYMLDDEVLLLNVRSNQGKLRIQLANTIGYVDASFYNNPSNNGCIGLFLRNEGNSDYVIEKEDRIAQGMFIKYLITDDDNPIHSDRIGGFGSSDNREVIINA